MSNIPYRSRIYIAVVATAMAGGAALFGVACLGFAYSVAEDFSYGWLAALLVSTFFASFLMKTGYEYLLGLMHFSADDAEEISYAAGHICIPAQILVLLRSYESLLPPGGYPIMGILMLVMMVYYAIKIDVLVSDRLQTRYKTPPIVA